MVDDDDDLLDDDDDDSLDDDEISSSVEDDDDLTTDDDDDDDAISSSDDDDDEEKEDVPPEIYQRAQSLKVQRLFREEHGRPHYSMSQLSFFARSSDVEKPIVPDDEDLEKAREESNG